ncbi:hypothetical protein MNBD_NITROSPINAE02-491 [hydrothermal vent metagenome]|uniref:Membrane-bound metal-dependent hydrolase YdjM, induced during SOS response n=1 Tax=hydrothermal vent metagenome TaxID=652676 RepID=A0A3B1CEH8_9ZZZZ
MPTPLGHSLAGLAIFALSEKRGTRRHVPLGERLGWGALCVVASNAPDLDFIAWGKNGLELTSRYHHGLTHSIGFAVMFGLAISLWAAMRGFHSPGKVFVLTSSSIWMHAVMDLFGTDNYPVNGIGLPLLWPVTGRYFVAPVMPGVSRAHPFDPASLFGLGVEFVLYSSILLSVLFFTRKKNR